MSSPKHVKIGKFISLLIPALIIIYLINLNLVLDQDFNYFYEVESKDYLSPLSRVSEPIENYRNLTDALVYFESPIPRGSDKVHLTVRYKTPDYSIKLGARDREEWHYNWKTIYNLALQNLSNQIHPGIFKINPELDDLNESAIMKTEGITIGTTKNIIQEESQVTGLENNEFIIESSLRGAHVFYLYLSGNLDMYIEKQDLNWYNGSDELEVSLYNSKGEILDSITFPDDGITGINKSNSRILEGIFITDNLPEGVYRLEFSDFDGLIRKLSFNTNKVVVSNKIYLADSDIYFKGIERPSKIYTYSNKDSDISFRTWHSQGLQTIKVNEMNLKIDEISNSTLTSLKVGLSEIISPKNDIIIESPGYFSFTEDSYFEPFINRIVEIQDDYEWIKNNLDYIITDYIPAKHDSGWYISEIDFNINESYLNNGKLSFAFNIPEISSESTESKQVSIDWINITVYKPGIL